jgi:hypothetical protein
MIATFTHRCPVNRVRRTPLLALTDATQIAARQYEGSG